ncbi:MAG: DMT family transporter [Candidatus Bathyarchaeota archaeon]|nr:DMT family transporter [Candidatus Bathyarchaeota archaeon]
MSDSPRFPPRLALVISIVAVSTASILIRWTVAPPIIIAAYRMVLSTLILSPFFLANEGIEKLRGVGTRTLLGLMGVGIVLAVHFASWITSLSLTSVASSVIFVHIDPVFVAVISHFMLKERINSRVLAGIVTALLGATIIAIGDAGLGEMNLYGDALALVGGVMLGIYILGGRFFRKNLDLTTYVTPVYATAALFLVVSAIVMGEPFTGYSLRDYGLFLAIAVVPMIFGHTVYNWALKYIEAPIVSISLLGEPVGASILAILFLDEVPTSSVLFGGIVTLAGILICAYRRE